MKVRFEGITMLADNVGALAAFYRDVIGLTTVVEDGHYVEFENNGIRLAICSRAMMADNTNQHPSFIEGRRGQSVELNFECDSPDDVRERFAAFVAQGAVAITEPQSMPWGHTTGFFADPEGNIHSLFAVNKAE